MYCVYIFDELLNQNLSKLFEIVFFEFFDDENNVQCTPDLVTHLVCQKTVTKSRGVTK